MAKTTLIDRSESPAATPPVIPARSAEPWVEPLPAGTLEIAVRNDAFRFETLVEGAFNRLAINAARAILETPGICYNPLYISGGVGIGKTHLLQAMAADFAARRPAFRVGYFTAESLVSGLVQAERQGWLVEARQTVRALDVFLLDDLQDLAGKTMLQEELLHAFDALYNRRRQMVFSADRQPADLGFSDRLRSRLQSGLTADIATPDLAARRALTHGIIARRSLSLPEPVLDQIAEHGRSARDIEGAIVKVCGYSALLKNRSPGDAAREILEHSPAAPVTVERIQEAVARYFNITPTDLQSRMRTRTLTVPRQIALFLARKHTRHPLEALGGLFGGRDHSTVNHSIHRIERQLKHSQRIRQTVSDLEALLFRQNTR